MHDHDLISQLGRPDRHAIDLHNRVAALETWQHWADGGCVEVDELAAAVRTLTDPDLARVSPAYRQLGEAVTLWAGDTGLERQLVGTQPLTLRRAGLELGL